MAYGKFILATATMRVIEVLIVLSTGTRKVLSTTMSIPNYFGEHHVQFISALPRGTKTEHPPPYFEHILTNNPNTPILLGQIYVNLTHVILGTAANPLKNFRTRSGWASVSFLPSVPGDTQEKHYSIQRKIMSNFNPSFIFQHTDDPWNASIYQDYSYHVGISKLILFNANYPDDIFIPCILGLYSVPMKLWITPLPKMESVWWAKNTNLLHKKVIYTRNIDLKQVNCQVYHVRQMSSKDCKIVHLSQNLNFSIVGMPHAFEVSILASDTYSSGRSSFMMPYSVKFKSVQFSIITQYPSGLEGMAAFLYPFSLPVWLALLFGCVTICFVVQVAKEETTLIQVTFDIINIVALLLGQGNSSKICYKRRTFAAPIVTGWLLCGCYVLMENLYTGEIFSYLSAIKPPLVPETLSQLVDSDIPIITISSYSKRGTSGSTLMTNTIPCILASKPLVYFNTSIDPRQTYAIIDDHDNFQRLSTLLKINGSQSVLNGRDGTPFVSVSYDQRYKNWLSPLLARKLRQLEVSGIAGRWDDLQTVTDVEGVLHLIKDPAYGRYGTGVPPSRESAKETPIQLKAVKSIFILSSFLFLLALTSFGVEEGAKQLKNIGLGWLEKQNINSSYTIKLFLKGDVNQVDLQHYLRLEILFKMNSAPGAQSLKLAVKKMSVMTAIPPRRM
ncbi:Calsyntenin-2 [Folsomia candida]|uniref:Calsyntenin-2 n=1 Tax=Folsomia candida TaxID=158441 RepID=A0A226DET5_FOLCA|nr:Calsyntenin-2 [Folsomia candida]